ncbi:MAG: hypothetical protein ACFFDT_35540, partial [Candidatus Hodarchaeota archaeon]
IEILLANDESWKTFNTLNSGLAGNNVAAIVSDLDGINVWFGSGEDTLFGGELGSRGVTKYNRSTDKWEIFSTENGLIHNSVFSIDTDDYFVWFGTRGGVSRYTKNTKTWANFTTDSGLVENHIKQVKIGMDYVWFVSGQGKVCTFQKNSRLWSTFNVMLGSRVQAIDIDENYVWFATDNGVGKYDKNTFQWETYTSDDGLIDNYVTCLTTDGSFIWFGTQKGVSRFDKNTNDWVNFTTSNSGLVNNNISAIEMEDHYVWFVTKTKGISRLEKNTGVWETFNSENSGLSENSVQAIEIDANFVWFGIKRRGVSRYEKNKSVWRTFNKSDGLANNNVFSIGVDDDFVWFGTQEGVSRFDKKIEKFTTFNIYNSELGDDVILCIAMEDDYVWFGTEGGGVCRYKKSDGSWKIFDTSNSGIADNLIQCIAIDDDYIWMGTRENGLSRYRKSSDEWKNFTGDYIFPNESTLPSNDVRSIAADKYYVWVGFWHPMTFIEEAVFSCYEKSTGKWRHFKNELFGTWLAGNNIQSLGIDGDFVWIGFFEPGYGAMHRYSKIQRYLETFDYDDGLADRNVWAIGIDNRFNWFGTGSGVNRFDKKYEYFLTFNVSDGLVNNWVRSIGIDKDCVWLGTIGGGVSRYKDQSAPIIIHDPVTEEKPLTQAISISARIEENVLVTDAWLFYKITSSSAFDSIRMKNQFANYWVEEIPTNSVTLEGIDYFLKSDDGYNVGYHPWRYPSTPPHHISVYDDKPPEGYIKISPSYGKDVVFNNDWIYVEGNIDGTSSIPKIAGIQLIQYNIVGNQISRTNFPSNLITLKGEGTVRSIVDSLNVGSLNENTSSIELAIIISESDSVQDKTFNSNRLTVLQDRDFPKCVISQPTEGIEVGQVVPIIGTVYDAHLKEYKLEYGKGKKPTVWKNIPVIEFQPTVNIIDSLLGKWYTSELPDTIYSLRLNAWDYANHI